MGRLRGTLVQAALKLVAKGFAVSASVHGNPPLHHRIQALVQGGVNVQPRASRYPLWKQLGRRLTMNHEVVTVAEVRQFIETNHPQLVVFSSGGPVSPIEFLELCIAMRVPFVTIGQANTENWWFDDETAKRYRKALSAAMRCYFVSKGNLRLFEKQIGCELPNAEVVRNPFQVRFNASPAWPSSAEVEVLFACVARLHPPSKGQDLLLEALASRNWTPRSWRLTLYGQGATKTSLQWLVRHLGITDRVSFAGHVERVEDIWASNHVLILPSRYEGLPLAIIEAMLSGRPVIATDVGGNAEIIEDGITGFLAQSPTVASMSETLDRFWERRAEMRSMGNTARERIREVIPSDPIGIFADKIVSFVETSC